MTSQHSYWFLLQTRNDLCLMFPFSVLRLIVGRVAEAVDQSDFFIIHDDGETPFTEHRSMRKVFRDLGKRLQTLCLVTDNSVISMYQSNAIQFITYFDFNSFAHSCFHSLFQVRWDLSENGHLPDDWQTSHCYGEEERGVLWQVRDVSMGTFKHTFEKCEAGSQDSGLSRSRYITCLDCSNEVGLLFVWRDRPGEGLQQDRCWWLTFGLPERYSSSESSEEPSSDDGIYK